MTAPDIEATLRLALQSGAEAAMAATDTETELAELRRRLRPAARARRLRVVAAAAAVVALAGAGVGVGLAVRGSNDSGHRAPITTPPSPTPRIPSSAHRLPVGTIPPGFPVGSYQHPGTYGLTKLTLNRNGTAALQDPRGIPSQMRMTFATPNYVTFTITSASASTASTSCSDRDGSYTWAVSEGELTFKLVADPCGNRRIPLTEIPWGPVHS